MPSIIGRGRYARETYPQFSAGAGGSGTIPPLSRVLYVDGGTQTPVPKQDGSIAAPYSTIGAALATIPASTTSAEDNNSMWTILVAPCFGGYTNEGGTVTVPAYRNVTICGLPGQVVAGFEAQLKALVVNASLVWNNVANSPPGAVVPFESSLTLSNITFNDFTMTDDDSSFSFLQFLGNVVPTSSDFFVVNGNVDTTGASALQDIIMGGAGVGGTLNTNIHTGIEMSDAKCLAIGNLNMAASLNLENTDTGGIGITTNFGIGIHHCGIGTCPITSTNGDIIVTDSVTLGPAVLTATSSGSAVIFDGPSYLSFIEQGGTVNGVTLVIGGFLGAPVPGATINDPAAPPGSGLHISLAGGNYYRVKHTNIAVTEIDLDATNALPGDVIYIASQDPTGNLIIVVDSGTGNNVLSNSVDITSGLTARGFIAAQWTGTGWTFFSCGQIPLPSPPPM
jgi:hypothetical protein